MQFIMAIFVLRTQLGKDIFKFLSQALTTFLEFAKAGVEWLTDTATSNLCKWPSELTTEL